jgi:hypothetical protein
VPVIYAVNQGVIKRRVPALKLETCGKKTGIQIANLFLWWWYICFVKKHRRKKK